MSVCNIRLEQDKENPMRHTVYIGGKEVSGITHMDFSVDPYEIPEMNIETYGTPDFDGVADVNIVREPTIQEAVQVIRDELLKHGDLYDGFVASILSVLKENSRYAGDGETEIIAEYGENFMAEEILKRIIGED